MSFFRGQSISSETGPTSRWKTVRWFYRAKHFLWSDLDGVQYVDRIQMEREKDGLSIDQDLQPGFSPYDDYHTIDWVQDFAKDRTRHRSKRRKEMTCPGKLKKALDACSAWICVSVVGVLCGCVAALIDIGTGWLSDMKDGLCASAFWLNKEQCCWFSNSTEFEGDDCDEWHKWAMIFGYNDDSSSATKYAIQYALHVAVAVTFSTLAVMLVRTFAPFAVGGGIPEIKTVLSGFIIRGLLGKWTLIIKTVGVMLAVAAGLVLGKEGPLVHIACCIGNIVTYFFPKYGKNEAKKREILSAAAAAGVSVAFGAPIGGVLFSLEEVSYYFPLKTLWRTFFCALVASFVLSSINPFGNDHMIVFYVDYDTPWVFVELIPFAFLGVLGGFFGAIFIYANVFWCKLRKTSKLGTYPTTEAKALKDETVHSWEQLGCNNGSRTLLFVKGRAFIDTEHHKIDVLVITLITALLSFPSEYTRLDTSELIGRLVRNCGVADVTELCDYQYGTDHGSKIPLGPGISNAMWKLSLAFLFKFVMLVVTVGMKVPAGLYIPSLAIGAIIGRMVGVGMEQLARAHPNLEIFIGECGSSCITPGLYAMIGAVAFLGGITRMTVGLVVIMFEVTGGVRYIVPLMIAVMMSKWTGDALCEKGIFEALIDLNDYPFLDSKEEFRHTTQVSDVLRPRNRQPIVVLTQDSMTVDSIEQIMLEHTFKAFPVVVSSDSQYLIGLVLRRDLYLALAHARCTRHELKGSTEVTFTDSPPLESEDGLSAPLQLHRIVDVATITITDVTPMEMVVDMFRKLGFRQLLVTHKGRLLGIITKKDVLRHIKQLEHQAHSESST